MAATVAATGCWTLEIVKRTDAHRFFVLPKRWIVERTFARISRNRRLARDFEHHARTVVAFIGDARLNGILARMGGRVLTGVARMFTKQFFEALEKEV